MTRNAATPPRRTSGSARRVVPDPEDGWGPGTRRRRSVPHLGPLAITPFRVVLALAFLGSGAYIAAAILFVRDTSQIPMLSSGFAVLGLASAAVSLGFGVAMWRAATSGGSGRALVLAILGGGFGLAAIGSFTLTVVLALLWKAA
jgi:hypothetical protein